MSAFELFFYKLLMGAAMGQKIGQMAPPNQWRGLVIWYAHQGPMRIHHGPKLTKAAKKAAKKARRMVAECGKLNDATE